MLRLIVVILIVLAGSVNLIAQEETPPPDIVIHVSFDNIDTRLIMNYGDSWFGDNLLIALREALQEAQINVLFVTPVPAVVERLPFFRQDDDISILQTEKPLAITLFIVPDPFGSYDNIYLSPFITDDILTIFPFEATTYNPRVYGGFSEITLYIQTVSHRFRLSSAEDVESAVPQIMSFSRFLMSECIRDDVVGSDILLVDEEWQLDWNALEMRLDACENQ